MNKTNLLITAVLFLLMCGLAVTVPAIIHLVLVAEDTLKIIGLMTTCFGVVKVVELVKNYFKK